MAWGGVGDGMITFLAHAHIFDATPLVLCCYGDGRVGWGGVGDGMITFLAHAHIFESIAQKAWDNVCARCFAVVQK